jgi:hypothetical protein
MTVAFLTEYLLYRMAEPRCLDRADCAVRAVSVAANADYLKVFALFSAQGRKPHKGSKVEWIAGALDAVRPERAKCMDARLQFRTECPTLDQWVRANPRGRWVVCVTGHAIAVVDGVVHDWGGRLPGGRRKVVAWFAAD